MQNFIGVDIGGTFTDAVLISSTSDSMYTAKALTTPSDPGEGLLTAVRAVLEQADEAERRVEYVVHGTTLITNAVIERRGAKTAAFITGGFRDVFEIGRESRYDIYDVNIERPAPIVPRYLSIGVPERMDAAGRVIRSPNVDELLDLTEKLVTEEGVESLAICFLHSYANPVHEQVVRDAIEKRFGDRLAVSISYDIAPAIGEYERASTTAINAYVRPLAGAYLESLSERLSLVEIDSPLYIMLSHGGLGDASTSARHPVRMLESGPAGGVTAATFVTEGREAEHVLAFDMGGTTAKACFIDGGSPEVTTEWEAARVRRFKKGSGLPVSVPIVEMIEIGAGGGSIASVNGLGMLEVGPESAGAEPGPACYRRGGDKPTVTDAAVALGFVGADAVLGGTLEISKSLADEAMISLGARDGRSAVDSAWGVHSIVTENMVRALQMHAFDRGKDIRDYELVATGGAGPMHAAFLADAVGIQGVTIPWAGGVASAIGFLAAPAAMDIRRTRPTLLENIEFTELESMYDAMTQELLAGLSGAGVTKENAIEHAWADMRFAGQTHTIRVSLPEREKWSKEAFSERFRAEYQERFGRRLPASPVEILNWELRVSGPRRLRSQPAWVGGSRSVAAATRGTRLAYYGPDQGFQKTPVLVRSSLGVGAEAEGPAIIEDEGSTAVVPPDWSFCVDQSGNLRLSRMSPATRT